MADGTPGGGDIQSFLRGLARKSITDFIVAVATDGDLIAEISAIDLAPVPVAAFAREKGFSFSADELAEFVEDRIRSELPADEVAIREDYLAARARGDVREPASLGEETEARLHDEAHRPGFVLDREAVLRGDVVALRVLPSLPALLSLFEETLVNALGIDDLEAAHAQLTFEELKARTDAAHDDLTGDDRIVPAVLAIIDDLGLARERVVWEWPGFRLLFPVEAGGRGVYRTANSGALSAHRDTWYGSPQHEINLWGPIKQLDADATLRILTRYFRKTVANSSSGYDVWQNFAGIALPPGLRAAISADGAIAPPLAIGDVMCFAGHQLHASAVNRSGRTRVSFEFRLLHADDEGANYVPPNVDYFGRGEIYKGWFDGDGGMVNRLTGQTTPR